MSDFKVEIVTPDGIKVSGEITSCVAPGVEGQFQILTGHAPLLSLLEIGEIKIEKPEGSRLLASSSGFLEVNDNLVSIVVESAEFAEDIDVNRAKSAEERAKKRLDAKEEMDIERAKFAMLRALNRIKISSRM